MTSAQLAWRTVQRYRARTILATIGVAVIGALLFDMLLLSHGLVASFADLLERSGYDVRVLGTQGLPMSRAAVPDAAAVVSDIERLPEVASVARIRLGSGTATGTDGQQLDVSLVGASHTGTRVGWTVMKGADLPSDSHRGELCPVLVGTNLAARLRLEPGDALGLRGNGAAQSTMPDVACRVVGIGNSLFTSASDFSVLTTIPGLQAITGGDDNLTDLVLVASQPAAGPAGAVTAITALRSDIRAYSNEDVLAQFNENGFAYFRQISVVLSSITIVFTFLLVATILTVSTNQRLGEIAALRALGIGRPRIAKMLLWESVLVVGGGGVLALPLGALIAVVLDRILKQMPGLPDALHFFVFETSAIVWHVVLLAVTALVAAAYPIWLTTRLPIASTLRREVVG